MKKKIKDWEKRTNEIVENWLVKVFDLEDEEIDYWWVADSVGTVFNFGDYFVNFDAVLEYYKHNLKPEDFFSWYDFCLTNQKVNISLAKFIISPQEKKEQLKKQLEQSKERLKQAKEEFEKSLKEFEEKYGK
jgi:hypothetical protein